MVYYRSMCSTLLLGTFNVQLSEQFCWHCNFLCNFFYLCNEKSVGLGVCLNCSSVVVAISKDIGCPYHKSEHSTGSSPHSRSLQMSHECFETHLKIRNKNVVLFIIKIMLINIIIILIFINIIINVLYLVWRPPMMPSSSWRESLPRSWPSRRTC